MLDVLQKFERARPFTETEAWLLFRIAAVGEAVGWTLLISGILVGKYLTPGNGTALILAGRTHGMLFIMYIITSLGLYPCLNWSRGKALIAAIFSVPPYGTLVFEWYASWQRHSGGFKSYRHYLVYNVLTTAV
jgi:integral membrane protein